MYRDTLTSCAAARRASFFKIGAGITACTVRLGEIFLAMGRGCYSVSITYVKFRSCGFATRARARGVSSAHDEPTIADGEDAGSALRESARSPVKINQRSGSCARSGPHRVAWPRNTVQRHHAGIPAARPCSLPSTPASASLTTPRADAQGKQNVDGHATRSVNRSGRPHAAQPLTRRDPDLIRWTAMSGASHLPSACRV